MAWQLILIWTSLNAREQCKKNPHKPFNWKFSICYRNWHSNSASRYLDIWRSCIFWSKKERTKYSDQLSNIIIPKLRIGSTRGKGEMLCCTSFHISLILKTTNSKLNTMAPKRILHPLFVLLKHESGWTKAICKFLNSSIFTQKLQIVQIPKAECLLRASLIVSTEKETQMISWGDIQKAPASEKLGPEQIQCGALS